MRQENSEYLTGVSEDEFLDSVILRKEHNPKKDYLIKECLAALYEKYPAIRHFHNHSDKSDEKSNYPLVHYRAQAGHPHVVAFNDAIPIMKEWLLSNQRRDGFNLPYLINQPTSKTSHLKSTEHHVYYRLMDWMALNGDNYKLWRSTPLMRDRIVILEQALTGHIRRLITELHKGELNAHAEIVSITKMKDVKAYHHKDLAFNIIYRCKVEIPTDLAMGKAVSIGFGTQNKTRWQGEGTDIIPQLERELSTIES